MRGYSRREIYEMEFPQNDYDFPLQEGEFTGVLVMKRWLDNHGLLCYFDCDCGNKYKICVWYKGNDQKDYRPKNSTVDVSRVDIGTIMRVEHSITKGGKTRWDDIEILERSSI